MTPAADPAGPAHPDGAAEPEVPADPDGAAEPESLADPVDDERWLVVDGRRWRRQDPSLPEDEARRLLSHLGRGRSGVRALRAAGEDPAPARRRVDLAKHGLGERGTPWWDQSAAERQARWEQALAELDGLDRGP